jgi:hypothetical protein
MYTREHLNIEDTLLHEDTINTERSNGADTCCDEVIVLDKSKCRKKNTHDYLTELSWYLPVTDKTMIAF